jgi:uncharacterized damage-inducible protein DinB
MPTDLRYPIGPFTPITPADPDERARLVDEIAALPERLAEALTGASETDLERTYRDGGWTVRQVVHHVADSHLNAYTRFKLALTEDDPTIKPYDEGRWAELADVGATPIGVSLALLVALHQRWVVLLRSLTGDELARTYRHPEHGRVFTLDETLALYAWHGRHHTAHVRAALEPGSTPATAR